MYIYSFASTLTPTLLSKGTKKCWSCARTCIAAGACKEPFEHRQSAEMFLVRNTSQKQLFTLRPCSSCEMKKCLHFMSKEWSRQIMVCWHIFGGRTISIIGTTGRHRAPADVTWHASNIWNTDINAKHTQPLCCLYVQNSHHCLIFWRWCFMACFLVPRQRMTESWMRF